MSFKFWQHRKTPNADANTRELKVHSLVQASPGSPDYPVHILESPGSHNSPVPHTPGSQGWIWISQQNLNKLNSSRLPLKGLEVNRWTNFRLLNSSENIYRKYVHSVSFIVLCCPIRCYCRNSAPAQLSDKCIGTLAKLSTYPSLVTVSLFNMTHTYIQRTFPPSRKDKRMKESLTRLFCTYMYSVPTLVHRYAARVHIDVLYQFPYIHTYIQRKCVRDSERKSCLPPWGEVLKGQGHEVRMAWNWYGRIGLI